MAIAIRPSSEGYSMLRLRISPGEQNSTNSGTLTARASNACCRNACGRRAQPLTAMPTNASTLTMPKPRGNSTP
ncbi:hypothetical protein D3C87_1381470 [compost metagenome]